MTASMQEDLEKAIQNCSEVALQNDREKMSKCHRVYCCYSTEGFSSTLSSMLVSGIKFCFLCMQGSLCIQCMH